MPLKHVALVWGADALDPVAQATGAANTACLNSPAVTRAWNTDVIGLMTALQESGLVSHRERVTVRVLGAGATATSAVAALQRLGITQIHVLARRPNEVLGIASRALTPATVVEQATAEFTVSTLPTGATLDPELLDTLAVTGGGLFDVAYEPWPTSLARAWQQHGQPAVSGEGMLLHQAVAQIRIWLTGDVDVPLPREAQVVARMREALARA